MSEVDQMTLTIDLIRGEAEAISILEKMINYGLISDESIVRIGKKSREGRGQLSWFVKNFLK